MSNPKFGKLLVETLTFGFFGTAVGFELDEPVGGAVGGAAFTLAAIYKFFKDSRQT